MLLFPDRGHVYSLPVQANRPDSYAMLTTPYINTDGKCLEIFYFPNGTGFLNLDLIQENLEVKRIATTKNDDNDSLTTHRSFVSNPYFHSNAPRRAKGPAGVAPEMNLREIFWKPAWN